jgi:hypothetical protein
MSAFATTNHRREPVTMREQPTSSSLSRPGGRARLGRVLLLAGLAAAAPACGDGPICASDLVLFITAPDDGGAFLDVDYGLPGIQTDVMVRTNLHATELVDLRMIDESGFESRFTGRVDDAGTVSFPFITLPPGRVRFEARGYTSQCGSVEDAIEVQVAFGTGCDVQLGVQPVSNPYYAPLPVLDFLRDSNVDASGFQADVDVQTLPGYGVELSVIDLETGVPTFAGERVTDGSGLARYTLTIPEGAQALEARCVAPDGASDTVSERISAYVDSQTPGCFLMLPNPFGDLTPSDDIDGDPSNGLQIEMVGEVEDLDQSGVTPLPPLFSVDGVLFEGSEVDEQGESRVTVTLEGAGLYLLGIVSQDRAGNVCGEVWSIDYVEEGLVMSVVSRSSVRLTWVAPAMDGNTPASAYELRFSDVPIDASNFDFTGFPIEVLVSPAEPGALESFETSVIPGDTYYAALMATGQFGERRFLGAVGPVVPDFDRTDTFVPASPEDGNKALGYQVAAGYFNDDLYADVAVSAPFTPVSGQNGAGTVYVYFGGPAGLGSEPDVTIEGSGANDQLGNGLTAIRWNDDGFDDLAVGVPGANEFDGRVLVFLGGAGFGGNGPADADVTIDATPAAGDWFASSLLGFALARARFDSDGREDLVITAPGGGNGNGGVVVVYGGATGTSIELSSQTAVGSGDAVALVLEDPDPGSIFVDPPAPFFGHHVFLLGRTQGASDLDDDIGVAYTEKNAAVVFRGRARPASAGVTLAGFDAARDLEIRRTSSTDTSSRYGSSMGTYADLNNDGARELVVGMWRDGNNLGRVEIYDGDRVGVHNASAIRLRSISAGPGLCTSDCGVGSAVINNAAGMADPDVDGDGVEDLLIVSGMGTGALTMHVWFGSQFPANPDIVIGSANHVVTAPEVFQAAAIGDNDASPITASWIGDINGDGHEDLCWADWSVSERDGAFMVLYDDGQ